MHEDEFKMSDLCIMHVSYFPLFDICESYTFLIIYLSYLIHIAKANTFFCFSIKNYTKLIK